MTRAARSILGALCAGAVCYALAALAGPGVAPRQAVRAAQRGAGITVDGLCGDATCAAMGL